MVINIKNNSKFRKYYRKELINAIEYLLKQESKNGNNIFKNFLKNVNLHDINVNIIFTDDKEMRKYNKKYFNRNSPTDVIAFSMIENSIIPGNNILGDIIISLETVKRNAEIFGTGFRKELLLIVIHGMLHLLGYEHPDENSLMRKKEKKYLECILKILE